MQSMQPIQYILQRIDGDYAVLLHIETNDTLLVARAFLPDDADEGDLLLYEMLEYRKV